MIPDDAPSCEPPVEPRSALRDPFSRGRSRRQGRDLAGSVPALLPALRRRRRRPCSTSAPGFGEFLRHIRCGRRIAVDIERAVGPQPAARNRGSLHAESSARPRTSRPTRSTSCSAATSSSTCPTRRPSWPRCARFAPSCKPGGRLLALQPNIRFVGGAYWDFVDHHLPLTDRTLVEACESLGYEIVEVDSHGSCRTRRAARCRSRRGWCGPIWHSGPPGGCSGKQTWFVARKPR